MKIQQSLFVRAFCLWSAFVWLVLVKNMITDDEHELGFRLVHISIAIVSLTLAALSWPRKQKANG